MSALKFKIRKKDKVMIIAGRDKGKTGEVIQVYPEKMRLLVAKVNMVTKHKKPTQTEPGGLQKLEAPISYSNAMIVCPKCDKPVRVKLEKLKTGELVRACRKCNESIL